MLSLLKKKNPYSEAARQAYSAILNHTRQPVFYKDYAVTDSFDGRFDLMLLHVFLVIDRLQEGGMHAKQFGQGLFDAAFADMDQTLREIGIGDMGVPKHMRRMMKAFNGRMHVYTAALKQGEEAMKGALRRNLYGTKPDVDEAVLAKMATYIFTNSEFLKTQSVGDILSGQVIFKV